MRNFYYAPRIKFTPELWWKWHERALITPEIQRRRREIELFRKTLESAVK